MDIRQAIQHGLQTFDDISDSPRLDTELLLCKVLHRPRTFLYSHPDEKLTTVQIQEFQALLDIRQQAIPMAYILGEKEFWSMILKVGPHTLIPRPATESLIEYILPLPLPPKARICDLGTGTGAIAISLAKEKPNWQITATDIQSNAVAMAQYNAERHHLSNICFIWSDWFSKLYGQQFHLIVSNPPYIHPKDPHLYRDDVQYEPRLALASEDEGLFDLQEIIKTAPKYLYPQGILVLEHGYDQQPQVLALLKKSGYQNIQGFTDQDGLARFCVGTIMVKLNEAFFSRPTEVVAEELIGKSFIIDGQKAIITETEAYKGLQDPASHAFKGPTPRAKIMFGPCARLYVYLIYGMYHCLNIAAHEETQAGAVLIRGLHLEEIDLNGPGKICQYFQIDRTLNHHNIGESKSIYIEENGIPTTTQATSRIGIKKGTDKLSRFIRN